MGIFKGPFTRVSANSECRNLFSAVNMQEKLHSECRFSMPNPNFSVLIPYPECKISYIQNVFSYLGGESYKHFVVV